MIRSRKFNASTVQLVRATELEKSNTTGERAKTYCRWFIHSERHRELKYKSYLCFIMLLQMPLHHIMLLWDLVFVYGPALVLLLYIILMVGIALPMFMLFVFMGAYCRNGYIKYWGYIPLLKGAGYTIALMTMSAEFVNCSCAGLSLLYIKEMFKRELPWIKCSYEKVTKTCLTSSIVNYTDLNFQQLFNCTGKLITNNTVFSALHYLHYNKLNDFLFDEHIDLDSVKLDLMIAVTITWCLVLTFMVQGFLQFQDIMTYLQMMSIMGWLITFIATLRFPRQYSGGELLIYHGFYPMSDTTLWFHILMHVCDRDEPCSIILLSSLRHTTLPPNVEALIVKSFNLLGIVVIILWFPILLQDVLTNYEFGNDVCFTITGFQIIFAAIPDVLSRTTRWPQIWGTIWFVSVFIHCFTSVLYTFTGVIDSLINAYPKLNSYRIHMCVTICIMAAAFNTIFTTPLGVKLLSSMVNAGMVILRIIVLILVTFAVTYVYSIPRLINDYHFAYGEPPAKFWVNAWKVIPFVVLCETALMFFHSEHEHNFEQTDYILTLLLLGIAAIMLLPIFIMMFWQYSQHVDNKMALITPEADWGYYIVDKRYARDHFDPQNEIRYKTSSINCKHHCLVNSKKLQILKHTS